MDAVGVQSLVRGLLAEPLLQLLEVPCQAASEECWSQRVSLVHPAGCAQAVATPCPIPEEVLRGPAGKALCARQECRGKLAQPLEAQLAVGRAESIPAIQRKQDELWVSLSEGPGRVRQLLRPGRRAHRELASPEGRRQGILLRGREEPARQPSQQARRRDGADPAPRLAERREFGERQDRGCAFGDIARPNAHQDLVQNGERRGRGKRHPPVLPTASAQSRTTAFRRAPERALRLPPWPHGRQLGRAGVWHKLWRGPRLQQVLQFCGCPFRQRRQPGACEQRGGARVLLSTYFAAHLVCQLAARLLASFSAEARASARSWVQSPRSSLATRSRTSRPRSRRSSSPLRRRPPTLRKGAQKSSRSLRRRSFHARSSSKPWRGARNTAWQSASVTSAAEARALAGTWRNVGQSTANSSVKSTSSRKAQQGAEKSSKGRSGQAGAATAWAAGSAAASGGGGAASAGAAGGPSSCSSACSCAASSPSASAPAGPGSCSWASAS
eukprot:11203478-Lingulodinium_polyedra.AAC.1